ncbi:hypothetical protein CR203_08865 [Salipaludibacillus neizhouensis]|uniref:Rv2525c-like glycoside hydrolase-like domain-containing protein n=1 Tax=Salipaludibacillus neizhouensis TaxID=885475 RepID=A0A3A9K7K3_9BACI|nr:glycoside hydrolase domain-containing protein [Salipaludibacillus neizhouensis]RKL67458.1 hypothetical protein CR203_08865 [Salipaludibacillus neizhouensis]
MRRSLFWGVDSAAIADQTLLNCVVTNFGQPDFWGRYLTTVPNVNEGLSKEEITFMRNKGIKLLPIYNNFQEAIGYSTGRVAARNAIFNAQRLGINNDTFIFANVENFFNIDADWLMGWADAFDESSFRPGYYNDPVEGDFNEAFCQAQEQNENVRNQTVLWSAEPEPGVTRKRDIPAYNPESPTCGGNVWAWQYGRDAEICPIDTVLMEAQLFNSLS